MPTAVMGCTAVIFPKDNPNGYHLEIAAHIGLLSVAGKDGGSARHLDSRPVADNQPMDRNHPATT